MQEYVNTHDQWYAPKAQSPCRWLGTHFDHECHGGIITDIDAMVQMTKLNYSAPGSWNDADMLQLWRVHCCVLSVSLCL